MLQSDQLAGSLRDRLVEPDEGSGELLRPIAVLADSLHRSTEADRESGSFLVSSQLFGDEALNQIGEWDDRFGGMVLFQAFLRFLDPFAVQAEISKRLLLAHSFGLPLALEFCDKLWVFVWRVSGLLGLGPKTADFFRLEAALFLLSIGQTRPGVLDLILSHTDVGLGRDQLDVLAEEVQRAQLLALFAGNDGVVRVAQVVKADLELRLHFRLLW